MDKQREAFEDDLIAIRRQAVFGNWSAATTFFEMEKLLKAALAQPAGEPVCDHVWEDCSGWGNCVCRKCGAKKMGTADVVGMGSPQPAVPEGWKAGNLVSLSADNYPGMGEWFVQIWAGPAESDPLIARVYGDTRQEARERAELLLAVAPEVSDEN